MAGSNAIIKSTRVDDAGQSPSKPPKKGPSMSRLTRRTLVPSAAVLAVSALALSACAGSGGAGSDDELTVWWFEPTDSAQSKAWTETLEAFEAKHPDVTVNFELKTWDQLQKSGQMILNSNEAPDILEYPKGNATAGAVAKAGLLTDLTEVAETQGWTDTLPPSLLNVGTYDEQGLMGAGALYGVPTYAEYVSVFYNEDMLSEAGFETPTTVEEFETQLAHFTDQGITPLALGASDYPIVHLVYALALSQADQNWVSNFQFFDGDVDFHDDAWTYAAETIAEWKDKGYIGADATGIDAEGAGAAFKAGTSPYFVSGSWWTGDFDTNIDSFEWGTFPFPGSGLSSGSGGNIWVVPTNSTQKDLAYEFISDLLSADAQTAVANYGGVAVAPDLAQVTNEVGKIAAADLAAILEQDGLSYYSDWPVAGYYDVWLAQSQGLLTNTVTPEQFLDTVGGFYDQGKADLGL
jgi:raffinose/stachyose/melibiose transport system substrate-binding protein